MRKLFLLIIVSTLSICAQAQSDSTAKQYLGVLTLAIKYQDDKNWTKADEVIVGQHFQRLVKFRNEGKVILAGRTSYESNNPDMMGLVIFFAANDEEAKQFMLEDPAVKNNIMLVKVHPYVVALNNCPAKK